MIAWEARARTYAAALPAPLPGWEAQPPTTRVQNSAVAGREVVGYRIYRTGSHGAGLNSVGIGIFNNPDGTAPYPIDIWRNEAQRKEKGWTMLKLAGRDAMEGKDGSISSLWFFLAKNNLFVSLTWQEPHMTREKTLEVLKTVDFARIEALAGK